MHYILSLDPGVTTGIAYAEYDDEKLRIKVGQRSFSHDELFEFLHGRWEKNFSLIYEQFNFRNAVRSGTELYPVEMIGVIRLFVEREGINVYAQIPNIQGPTAYWTDERLKKYGVYAVGLQHGRSATKHLLYWWQFKAGYNFHHNPDFTDYELIVER